MQLSGRVALVTGAGSGIGRASAVLLASQGAKVGLVGRSLEDLEEVAAEIRGQGGEALPLEADVSKADQVERAIEALVAAHGRLDIVFANAGVNGVWAPLEEIDPQEWQETLTINLMGTFLTVKFAAPHLKKRGGSVIVNSSINGTRVFSNTGATAYASSKAGQVAFAKMIALELAPHKVRVNVICPGAIQTDIDRSADYRNVEEVRIPVEFPEGSQPLTGGKPGRADQVAQLVLFLASDASDHITGTEIWIDGAESLLIG
jgi:NAD(P)-dependent dehydrogenase (short-subunit alcohol dehydrogenase family)